MVQLGQHLPLLGGAPEEPPLAETVTLFPHRGHAAGHCFLHDSQEDVCGTQLALGVSENLLSFPRFFLRKELALWGRFPQLSQL